MNSRDFLGLGGPGRGAWIAPESDKTPWFKIDFRDFREVRGIITQVVETIEVFVEHYMCVAINLFLGASTWVF